MAAAPRGAILSEQGCFATSVSARGARPDERLDAAAPGGTRPVPSCAPLAGITPKNQRWRTMADPIALSGTVEWSGENPGISLKEMPDGSSVALASFFGVVLSPHGRGHALVLLQSPQDASPPAERGNFCLHVTNRWRPISLPDFGPRRASPCRARSPGTRSPRPCSPCPRPVVNSSGRLAGHGRGMRCSSIVLSPRRRPAFSKGPAARIYPGAGAPHCGELRRRLHFVVWVLVSSGYAANLR